VNSVRLKYLKLVSGGLAIDGAGPDAFLSRRLRRFSVWTAVRFPGWSSNLPGRASLGRGSVPPVEQSNVTSAKWRVMSGSALRTPALGDGPPLPQLD
jgi:hypothetical protein